MDKPSPCMALLQLQLRVLCDGAAEEELAALRVLARRCALAGVCFRRHGAVQSLVPNYRGSDRERHFPHPATQRVFDLVSSEEFQRWAASSLQELCGAPWQRKPRKNSQALGPMFQLHPFVQLRRLHICMPPRRHHYQYFGERPATRLCARHVCLVGFGEREDMLWQLPLHWPKECMQHK